MIYTSYFGKRKTERQYNRCVSIAVSKPKTVIMPTFAMLVPDWNTMVKPFNFR